MNRCVLLLALLVALALPATARSQTLHYLGDRDNRVLGTLQPDGDLFVTCLSKSKLHLSQHPDWHLMDAPHAHCSSGRMHIDSAESDTGNDEDDAADKAAAAKERAIIRKMLAAEKEDDDQQ